MYAPDHTPLKGGGGDSLFAITSFVLLWGLLIGSECYHYYTNKHALMLKYEKTILTQLSPFTVF